MGVPSIVLQCLVSRLEQQWREGEMGQELGREHSVVLKTSYELVPERIHEHSWRIMRLLE